MRRIPASPASPSTTPAWTPRYDASRASTGTRPLINSPANLAGQTDIGTPGTLLLTPRPKKAEATKTAKPPFAASHTRQVPHWWRR
jgi:hypothetical protein